MVTDSFKSIALLTQIASFRQTKSLGVTSGLDKQYHERPSVRQCGHAVPNDQYERVERGERPNVLNGGDVVPNDVPSGGHSDVPNDGGVDSVKLHS